MRRLYWPSSPWACHTASLCRSGGSSRSCRARSPRSCPSSDSPDTPRTFSSSSWWVSPACRPGDPRRGCCGWGCSGRASRYCWCQRAAWRPPRGRWWCRVWGPWRRWRPPGRVCPPARGLTRTSATSRSCLTPTPPARPSWPCPWQCPLRSCCLSSWDSCCPRRGCRGRRAWCGARGGRASRWTCARPLLHWPRLAAGPEDWPGLAWPSPSPAPRTCWARGPPECGDTGPCWAVNIRESRQEMVWLWCVFN